MLGKVEPTIKVNTEMFSVILMSNRNAIEGQFRMTRFIFLTEKMDIFQDPTIGALSLKDAKGFNYLFCLGLKLPFFF